MSESQHVAIDVAQIEMILPHTVRPVFPRGMVIGNRYKIAFANLTFGKSMNEFYGTLVKNDTNGLIYFSDISYMPDFSKELNSSEPLALYTANYIFYAL